MWRTALFPLQDRTHRPKIINYCADCCWRLWPDGKRARCDMEPNYLFLPVYDAVKETGYAFTIDGQQLAKHYAEDTELNIFLRNT